VVEADAMRDDLVRAGVPAASVVRERCSLTTDDNARFVVALLRRLEVARITLVTCDWHMPRAAALFRQQGVSVEVIPVASPAVGPLTRWYRAGHEWVSARMHASRAPADVQRP
jgi:uncharacterized SAM-binding protein YcdF (DUF218 family)